MAVVASMFRIPAIALVANTLTPITPPMGARNATVINTTNGDVQLHTSDDGTEFITIATQFERPIPSAHRCYAPDQIAFWLKSTTGGTVSILWY